MTEYNIRKNKGKRRSDKNFNKNWKLHVRTSDYWSDYPDFPYKETHLGSITEENNFKKMFPGVCRDCYHDSCKHVVWDKINIISLARFRPNSFFGRLGKDVIKKIVMMVWTQVVPISTRGFSMRWHQYKLPHSMEFPQSFNKNKPHTRLKKSTKKFLDY